MKSITLAAIILSGLPLAAAAQAPIASAPAQPVSVIGTYDKASIVLAYYRSPIWAAILDDRRFELKTVKAANDTARAKELEKYGGESQDLAMQQLAGKAPIDNILAVLQPEFKELTGRMKLAAIVESPAPDSKAATVDVTSLLMDWLRASAETRKMATEMHQRPSGK
ncbi:MAG: hypothetical protein ABSG51_14775 [Terracidiphilus sp.]|jgi:hypothetical protein